MKETQLKLEKAKNQEKMELAIMHYTGQQIKITKKLVSIGVPS